MATIDFLVVRLDSRFTTVKSTRNRCKLQKTLPQMRETKNFPQKVFLSGCWET